MYKMKTAAASIGSFVKRGSRAFCAAALTLGVMAATSVQSFAQSASGNSGADQVIDGISDLTPIVTLIIGAAIALGFVVLAATIGWKVFKKFWG